MLLNVSCHGSKPAPSLVSLNLDGPRNPESTSTLPDLGGIVSHGPKIPGTRCPTCALSGKEVWVIPGRCCGYCGTPCDGH